MRVLEIMLRREETERLAVYDDATGKVLRPGDALVGHPTVGVGRALDTAGLSVDESSYLLSNDMARVTASRRLHFPWSEAWGEARQAVLESMLFQLGLSGVLEFKQALAAMQAGDWFAAAKAMRDSAWYRETPARAEREARQMETGVL